jgi:hypothetical protein
MSDIGIIRTLYHNRISNHPAIEPKSNIAAVIIARNPRINLIAVASIM